MKTQSLRFILFSILFAVLLLPEMQNLFNFVELKPLTGEFVPTQKQPFSVATWLEGDFQKTYERFYEEQVGFRNFFIRAYNQMDYSLFNEAHGGDIIVGKKGYLFQKQYLDAHAGMDFIGEVEIEKQVNRAATIAAQLKQKGILLIIAFAPSKADFFPEYVPASYEKKENSTTNYEVFRKKLIEKNLPFIDFNGWFSDLKANTPYPLYPKQGIHWSQYGVYIVVDSLLKYVQATAGLDLNKLYCDSIPVSYELKSTDYDLGDLSNVLFEMPHEKMPYPVLRIENNPTRQRPNMLAIGDSYYWNILNTEVPKKIFSRGNFWYYNHDVHADSLPRTEVVNLQTFLTEVERQQVILILQTESNLGNLGFGFFENVGNMLTGNITENPVLEMEEEIRNNPEWLEQIRKKAIEKNVSLDLMIRSDAEWMVKERAKNQ